MPIRFELAEGLSLVEEASSVLRDAWKAPVLDYSPAYLAWQMTFPSPVKLLAAAAYAEQALVGFASATRRRLQAGSVETDALVVSFVSVRPAWQGHGIAKGLYDCLLRSLRDFELPILTFAIPESIGGRTLLNAYPAAGFEMHSLGEYGNYAFLSRQNVASDRWRVRLMEDLETLSPVIRDLAGSFPAVLWNAPDCAVFEHYFRDPRPRKLLLLEEDGRPRGAAFVVLSTMRTATSTEEVVMLDTCWLPTNQSEPLRQLLHAAANLWPLASGVNRILMCPNLSGFDEATLRAVGARRTPARFHGYLCTAHPFAGPHIERTNLEVI